MNADLEPLLRPLQLGRLRLRNRIMMSPMTRSFSPGGIPGKNVAAYYARRAAGGVGLVVTEGAAIEHPAAVDDQAVPHMYGDAALAGWREVTAAVHAAGGAIMPQLWHQGPLRDPLISARPDLPGLRPSGLWGTPGVVSYPKEFVARIAPMTRPMTESEIADVIDAYGRAAAAAVTAGFNGIAIHGAHGYLIDSFLWADTNRRSDRWGGSARARSTFAAEVLRTVRRAVGPDMPILLRLSQHKQQDYRARLAETPGELEALLEPIVSAGVDVLDISTRRLYEPAFAESTRTLTGWVRNITGLPCVATGSAGLTPQATPALLAASIARGDADLIGVGRALLADPSWAQKIQIGVTPQGFDTAALASLT